VSGRHVDHDVDDHASDDEHDFHQHYLDEHDVDEHDVDEHDVNGSVGVDDDDLSGLLTGAELDAAAVWAHYDDHDVAVGCPEHSGRASDDRPWCDRHDQHNGSNGHQPCSDDSNDHDATLNPGVADVTDHDNRAASIATGSRIAVDPLSSRLGLNSSLGKTSKDFQRSSGHSPWTGGEGRVGNA
jgi:hypothetical protein